MEHRSEENEKIVDAEDRFMSRKKQLAFLLVILFSFLLYLPTIRYDFVYDDEVLLPHHPWIKDITQIPRIITSPVYDLSEEQPSNYYRPIQILLYQVIYVMFELDPAAYHLLNIIFYTLLCAAVFYLFVLLIPDKIWMAFAASLLFAAHPTHTEAVAWVASLSELTFCLFYILALICYIKGQTIHPKGEKMGWHIGGCILFFLAMLSKEMAATLPFILLLTEFLVVPNLRGGSETKTTKPLSRFLWKSIPLLFYIGTLIAALSLRLHALGSFLPEEQHSEIQGLVLIYNAVWLLAAYLGKLIFPVFLNLFYMYEPVIHLSDIRSIIGLSVTGSAILIFILLFRRIPLLAFSLGLLFLSLLPVLNLRFLAANVFADRYLLISSVGFALALTILFWRLIPSQWIVIIILIAISLFFSYRTVIRNEDWKNSIVLYEKTLRDSPEAALIHNNLGVVLSRKGDIPGAIKSYEQAVHYKQDLLLAWRNLGSAYINEGRKEEALKAFEIAARMAPDDPRIFNNIGSLLGQLHRYSEAAAALEKALILDPNDMEPHLNLGFVLLSSNQAEKSTHEFRTVLEADPGNNKARVALVAALVQTGKMEEAHREAQHVQGELTDHPIIRKLLGTEGKPERLID
jgi:tetratricopeptide (TPR) repeat protein